MKYFIILLLLVPSTSFGDAVVNQRIGDWDIVVFKDEFTDKTACALYTKNFERRGSPGIVIFAKHSTRQHVLLRANSAIDAVGITYRVDKNKPVTFGYKYEFQTDKDLYYLQNSEYNQLVNDFKAGNYAVYEGHSGNQFVDSAREKISLKGFSRAYGIAEKCNF